MKSTPLGTDPTGTPNACIVPLRLVVGPLIALATGATFGTAVSAKDVSSKAPFFRKLAAPMTAIVEGKPFRSAIEAIAREAEINVWIDRHVDPTAVVSPGVVGPTVFGAIKGVAEQRECVLMPVSDVLLVGRPGWVDQTTDSLMAIADSASVDRADIAWDDLTTPAQAFAVAVGSGSDAARSMPHDLWPAVRWQQMDRRIALTLILAQFDRRPEFTDSLDRLSIRKLPGAARIDLRYSLDIAQDEFKRALVDSGGSARVNRNTIRASGSAAAHRAGLNAFFRAIESRPTGNSPGRGSTAGLDAKYTVRKSRAPAVQVFRQLSAAAQRECVINADVAERCNDVVTIEGEDLTLRQLLDSVAEQVDAVVTWSNSRIVVSAKRK